MLNFRFHIVSLVAVFLALAIGIIMGSTVIDRALVDTLEDQQQTLRANLDGLEDDNAALRRELGELRERSERLASEGGERLLAGTLRDVPVLVLAVRGVDSGVVDDLRDLLVTAGAIDEGTLWLTDRFLLDDDGAVADLAEVLRADPASTADSLREAAVEAVAAAVRDGIAAPTGSDGEESPDGDPADPDSAGPDGGPTGEGDDDATAGDGADGEGTAGASADGDGTGTPPADDADRGVVAALREAGFVDYDAPEGADDEVDVLVRPGSRVVLVAGITADVPDRALAVPLARALADQGSRAAPTVPLLAAEAQPDEDDEDDQDEEGPGFVSLLRDDDVADRLSTVDNLETFAGRVATVVALQDLGTGRRGHYGDGPGAERLVPAREE